MVYFNQIISHVLSWFINNNNYFVAEHAEYKTIASYKGTASLRGCTLYVTQSPCNVCARLIAQTGIVEVVYLEEYKKTFKLSKEIFKNCSIICRFNIII